MQSGSTVCVWIPSLRVTGLTVFDSEQEGQTQFSPTCTQSGSAPRYLTHTSSLCSSQALHALPEPGHKCCPPWDPGQDKLSTVCSLQLSPTLCDPHKRQPTRLPCPWDSPGICPWDCPSKNTGVGCHFLLQCMKVKSESEVAQSCLTL